jgi:hypothetical protein
MMKISETRSARPVPVTGYKYVTWISGDSRGGTAKFKIGRHRGISVLLAVVKLRSLMIWNAFCPIILLFIDIFGS